MPGAGMVAILLVCVAMLLHDCRSQDCLETASRTYHRTLISEAAASCVDQGTGMDLIGASTKCSCAQLTEEQGRNTFRFSEEGGCRAFQAVPAVTGEETSERTAETVEVYVAEETIGDTAPPPDDGPIIVGLELTAVNPTELVAVWDGVGNYKCRAVSGYRARFNNNQTAKTSDLTTSVTGVFNPPCEQYNVTVTALDEEDNEFGTSLTVDTGESPSYIPGGVIVAGGQGISGILSDVESINTCAMPDLPKAVYGHTLSQVGSQVYSCGGGLGDEATDECYTLDLSSRPPVWESSPNLPQTMVAHTAVTIGSHIWFTLYDQLYDLSTEEQLFRTYTVPMMTPQFHCAVSNDTHAYIIGAGEEGTEIWVNKLSSRPEEWLLVANLSSVRLSHACLWFEENVFIAGAYGSESSFGGVVLLNTETNIVTGTGSLLQARSSPGMFVLDGEPAVVGFSEETDLIVNTVETFDMMSETWRANLSNLLTARIYFGLVQLR